MLYYTNSNGVLEAGGLNATYYHWSPSDPNNKFADQILQRIDKRIDFRWDSPVRQQIPLRHLYGFVQDRKFPSNLVGEYSSGPQNQRKILRLDPGINFFWGTGDNAPGGVDFSPEVYVGRIPVYDNDMAQLDQILGKIISYELAPSVPEWRRRALLVTKPSDEITPGYDIMEKIKDHALVPAGLGYYRIYDEDYGLNPPPEATPCEVDQVIDAWKDGYGLVSWFTHGSSTSASYIFTSDHCPQLNDLTPAFTLQISCNNGYPEHKTNLGYSLLKHGAIGTVSATRVSWYTPGMNYPLDPYSGTNNQFLYYYSSRLLSGLPSGVALYRTQSITNHWANNFVYNIYGDPSTSMFRPFEMAKADVIPLLDHSGSMSGYTSSSQTDTKIEVLRNASDQFVDMLEKAEGHQLGLVGFSTQANTNLGLQDFTLQAAQTAHSQIATLIPTSMTSIGDALQKAVEQFETCGKPEHRKIVLLVTDGKENTAPMMDDPQLRQKLQDLKVKVFVLGLGYGSGIDENKLAALAQETGGDYRVTDNDLIFRKYFIEILTNAAAGWDVITDPEGSLQRGESANVPVSVSEDQELITFATYWEGIDQAVELKLISPSGEILDANISDSHVKRTQADRYAFCQIQLPLPQAVTQQWAGNWQMQLTGTQHIPQGQRIRYAASAFGKEGVKMEASFENLSLLTGDQMVVKAKLSRQGRAVAGATVKVEGDVPDIGAGNLLFEGRVNLSDIEQARIVNGDTLSLVDAKLRLLNQMAEGGLFERKSVSLALFDDGQHDDGLANDGIYANRFAQTQIPGIYTFRFMADQIPGNQSQETREWTKSFFTEVNIDPEHSMIKVTLDKVTEDGYQYQIKVVPKDRFGNYLGPGRAVQIAPTDNWKKSLDDNIDGTYTGDFFYSPQALEAGSSLQISVGENHFTTISQFPRPSKWQLSLHAGWAYPYDSLGQDFSRGLHVAMDVGYYLPKSWSILGIVAYNAFGSKDETLREDTYWLNGSANIRYSKILQPHLIGHIQGGPGVYLSKQQDWQWGTNLGISAEYAFNWNFGLELGSDYHVLFNQPMKFLQLRLGAIFKW